MRRARNADTRKRGAERAALAGDPIAAMAYTQEAFRSGDFRQVEALDGHVRTMIGTIASQPAYLGGTLQQEWLTGFYFEQVENALDVSAAFLAGVAIPSIEDVGPGGHLLESALGRERTVTYKPLPFIDGVTFSLIGSMDVGIAMAGNRLVSSPLGTFGAMNREEVAAFLTAAGTSIAIGVYSLGTEPNESALRTLEPIAQQWVTMRSQLREVERVKLGRKPRKGAPRAR